MIGQINIILIVLVSFHYGHLHSQDTSSVQLGVPVWADYATAEESSNAVHFFDLNIFVEYLPVNFSSYRKQIEDYNIDLLNLSEVFLGFNFQYIYQNHSIGLDLGFSKNKDDYQDSLHLGVNGLMVGLSYSYRIINREKWEFSPIIAARWFRYRMMNSNIEYDLDLNTHLEDRDLDLRFNQAVGSVGGKINFKLPHYENRIQHVNLAVYGGYQFKLHQKTQLYSRRNRLDAGGASVKYDGWFVGVLLGYRVF